MTNRDFDADDAEVLMDELDVDKEIILSCFKCDKEKAVNRCVYETIEPLDEAVRVEYLCMECGQGTKGSETFHFDKNGDEIFYGTEDIKKWPDNAMEVIDNE